MIRTSTTLATVAVTVWLMGCSDGGQDDTGDEQEFSCATLDCTDALGCVCTDPGDAIEIGTAFVVSGDIGVLGQETLNGVQIAVDLFGQVHGHGVTVVSEDSLCSPEGGTAAANALVAQDSITAVVGTNCSGAALTAAPIISDAGLSMVSPTNSVPALTDPATHEDGYLRTSWNDIDQAKALAVFAWNTLEATTSATLYVDDPYSEQLAEMFAAEFESLGGDNVSAQTVAFGAEDIATQLAAIETAGVPDILFFPVFMPVGGVIIQDVRADADFDDTAIAATDGLMFSDVGEVVGDDLEGMYFSAPDLRFTGEVFEEVSTEYESAHGTPLFGWYPMAHDAALMILTALDAVGVAEDEGSVHFGRQALRDALFATDGLEGASGTLTCDENGDCGAVGIALYQIQSGEAVAIEP